MENTKTTARDFFLWVAAMAALYVSAISFLVLVFEYIDALFADPFQYADPYSTGMRLAMASLVIIFPLFLFLFWKLQGDIRTEPSKRELWIRRWLIFLSLFIAGGTVVIDLIVLINRFLGGEVLTTAFLLKVAAVLIVIGGGFLYFLKDIQGYWVERKQASRTIGGIVAAIVLVSFIGGFFIIGTPAEQREFRFDQERVNDLQNIQWQVINYYQQKEALPPSLDALEDPLVGFSVPRDPRTNESYEYRVVNADGLIFELCATFARESRGMNSQAVPVAPRGIAEADFWQHDAGTACFERTIDPERFPAVTR